VSTFADFALLAAVPSYGGAEILRAQRVLPMGPGPRVHLALFGRNDAVMRRVVAAANAGAAILHPAIARIYEVARYDGVVYGVGDPSEGLDLAALMGGRKGVSLDLALAIVASLARVAVAIHDAGGPGYRGPPLGLGAVLSGGLSLDTVFLEPGGAVRIRPLAAAGNDPEVPSTFRAPEGQVSMAADVYALGRVLMALLSGDASGRTIPRLSSTSTLPQLLARLIHKHAAERIHLHEAVTRLEAAMREQGATSADQVIRTALAGPLRSLVVDPGFGLDAPPRVVDALRMQLAWIYPAIERLWPTMTPSVAPPPPPAFAALPPSTSDEGNAVFTDARPVRRQKAKTAATVLFNPAEARGALPPSVSDEGGAFKPKTSPTLMISKADLARALPPMASVEGDPDDRPDKTKLIDPASFRPFAPPPPPSLGPSRPVSPPTPPPIVTPPPARSGADRVFTGAIHIASDVHASDEAFEERTQMLPPEEAAVILVQRKVEVADAGAIADAFASAFKGSDDDVFADDGAFSPSGGPSSTAVAPPPLLSEPGGGVTDAIVAVANASTALAAGRIDATESAGSRAAPEASLGAFGSTTGQVVDDDDDPDSLDDAADFVMVGEAGRTFDDEKNPFKASTRMIPAQAMLRAMEQRSDDALSNEAPDERDDDAGVFSAEGAPRSPGAATFDDDDIRTEMVSADHVASMLRGIEAARAPAPVFSVEGPPETETRRPRAVSGLSAEGRRLPTPPTPRASVPDGGALSQLVIDAPAGATVSVNGTAVGTGAVTVDVGGASRCVVKVTLPGHVPFTTVVMVQGRPRVRVKPVLKPR
jgi:serine/threonine protein kinase